MSSKSSDVAVTTILQSDAPRPLRLRSRFWFSVATLGILVFYPLAFQWDVSISQWIQSHRLKGDLEKTLLLAEAFGHGSGVIVILASLIYIDRNHHRLLVRTALYIAVSSLVANGLKYVLPRLRPHANFDIESSYATWLEILSGIGRKSTDLSFPSGHSATAIAMAIGLTMVYPRGRWIFTSLAILTCCQRVYVGAHYPSDCIVGAIIAITIAWMWPFSRHELAT